MSVPTFAAIVGPPWFRDMCAGWFAHLHRKGRRPKTLISYKNELRAFGRWLEQQPITEAEHLTGGDLERWQDFRAGSIATGTQHVAAAAVRGLLRWAATTEPALCPPTLWLRVITPRLPALLPRPIPQRDLEKILTAIAPRPDARDLRRLRTRALFLVILTSGARITEALSLDRDQFRDRMAIVVQKGGGEKLLMISRGAEIACDDYVAARSDSCDALFVSHNEGPPAMRGHRLDVTAAARRAMPAARLQHHGVQRNWDALCSELAIPRWTSHRIRHSCATELLRQHVDALIISKHLGQVGLKAIGGYAQVGVEMRQQAMEDLDVRLRGNPVVVPFPRVAASELGEAELTEALKALRSKDLEQVILSIEAEYEAMTPTERAEADAEAQRALADDSDEWGVDEMFTQLRWNHDASGSVTKQELEAFAELSRRPDLIEQAAMSTKEFTQWCLAQGGSWPLDQARI